ncbi:hypothetical protein BASA81_002621 [Batrachochytrium salamandrivorans]|nr:hypothetical protein BASA81_002621 [Batrachochytrium salamandrivorans]
MSFQGRTSFDNPVTCAWAPKQKLLATATLDGGGVGFGDVDSDFFSKLTLNQLDFAQGTLVPVAEVQVKNQRFASLAWGRGDLIAGGMTDGTVKLWHASSLEHKANLPNQAAGSVFIRSVQFHPTLAEQLAHSGPGKQVKVTDINTLGVLLETPSQAGEVSSLAWNLSDSAKHILAGGNLDSQTSVWDLRTKKPTCEIRDPRGASITCVAWSPNAANSYHLLIANDCGLLRLFDLRSSTNTPMTELQATSGGNVGIFDVDWCPQDDSLLVTCSKDNRMLLWDLESNQVVCEMHQDAAQHQPHQQTSNRRYEVNWSPSIPGMIAACSFDRSLQLFSVNNTLPRCPAWAKRVGKGASFGFGGRLVEFNTNNEVVLTNVHRGDRWSGLEEFERKLEISTRHDQENQTHDHLQLFCSEQEAKAELASTKEIWRVLKVLLSDNSRLATQEFLGYREEDILNPPTTAGLTVEQEESVVVRALTIGRFDVAVDLCFKFKRYDEGLYLANLGGPELLAKAQEMFLEAKQSTSKIMQLAKSIFNPQYDAEDWKQQLALLGSFASAEDFANQVNLLATTQLSLGPQTVCYMLARNVTKVGECWSTAVPSDDEFCEIGQVFSRVLANPQEFQQDRVMMNRFARLANKMADEGKFDLAKKYAAIASGVDYEAADLVQRIDYGLVWNAESEQRAREEEERLRMQLEEEQRVQAEQAALYAQEQAAQQAAYEQQQQQQAALYAQQQHQYQQQYPPQQQYPSQQHPSQQQYPPQQQYQQYSAGGYGQQQPVYQQQQQQPTYQQQPPAYQQQPPAYQQQPAAYQQQPPTYQQQPPTYQQQPQAVYTPPALPTYAPPPPAPAAYAPQAPAPTPAYAAPAPTPVYAAPTPAYTAPAYAAPTYATPAPAAPRVPENDGFGTTAGNANAGAKYGNRTVNAPPSAPAQTQQQASRPADPALQSAVASLQRALQSLKMRYSQQAPGSMEERRLIEAEKGLGALTTSLPLLNEFFQAKLKELAQAMDRSSFAEAHNIQLTLSSSSDWKEHKEWIKGLSHLIGVAQKDVQPAGRPAATTAHAGPPSYTNGPPPTGAYPPQQQYYQ